MIQPVRPMLSSVPGEGPICSEEVCLHSPPGAFVSQSDYLHDDKVQTHAWRTGTSSMSVMMTAMLTTMIMTGGVPVYMTDGAFRGFSGMHPTDFSSAYLLCSGFNLMFNACSACSARSNQPKICLEATISHEDLNSWYWSAKGLSLRAIKSLI